MRVCFVILHYLADKETVECIESIRTQINYEDINIIVVDNASPNNSFAIIKKKYNDINNVILIENKENLGFARGNNVGFQYAKQTLKADFIVLLNNDTLIKQADFCKLIIEKYHKYHYWVLGPDVQTLDGFHQNPMKNKQWTLKKMKKFKIKNIFRLMDAYCFQIGFYILERKRKIEYVKEKEVILGDLENVRLHGSCLIFSPDYIKEFNGLDEGTFLYMEEDLLRIYADYYKFLIMYSSDLAITHKEDVSTIMVSSNKRSRNIRFLKNLLYSINICIKRLKEFEKKENKNRGL